MTESAKPAEPTREEVRVGEPRPSIAITPPPQAKKRRGGRFPRGARRVLGIVVIPLLVAGGVAYWYTTRNLESTDDAFIDGNAVQISPKVSGTVMTLNFTDNQKVHQGDLLLVIDPRDYAAAAANARASLANAEAQAAVARANLALTRATVAATLQQAEAGVANAKAAQSQSQAQVVSAQAEAVRARLDVTRYQKLATMDIASRQRYEQAVATVRSADAQLRATQDAVVAAAAMVNQAQGKLAQAQTAPEQIAVAEAQVSAADAQAAAAKAALETAELNLSYTKIFAPHDGVMTRRKVNAGDEIQKDQNLGALVFGEPWVAANFKETQLTRMLPGQPVEIRVDAYPGRTFKAHVDSIQHGTGAYFSLLPPENATGNYVKVVQRVPVKIVFDRPPDPRFVLGLGMSVVPTVDVSAEPTRTAASR